MIRATWNGAVLAESDRTIRVEGNQYFPPDDVRWEYLQESATRTRCPWKGLASYYSAEVDGKTNRDAAWYYPDASPAAAQITGYVAFWHGVRVERVGEGNSEAHRSGLARLFHR